MADPVYPNPAARLRAKILSQHIDPAKPIVIDGETFWIRTPLMADRNKIGDIAGLALKAKQDEKGGTTIDLSNVPMSAMIAAAVIVLAVDENGNPICTPLDLDALQAQPAGGWVEQLGAACLSAANGEKKVAPSAPPPADASPSSSPTV